jgi:hypothetical protein
LWYGLVDADEDEDEIFGLAFAILPIPEFRDKFLDVFDTRN